MRMEIKRKNYPLFNLSWPVLGCMKENVLGSYLFGTQLDKISLVNFEEEKSFSSSKF